MVSLREGEEGVRENECKKVARNCWSRLNNFLGKLRTASVELDEPFVLDKPRRMLHNQTLIMLILAAAVPISYVVTWLFAWTIMVFPATPMFALCVWALLVVYWIGRKILISCPPYLAHHEVLASLL